MAALAATISIGTAGLAQTVSPEAHRATAKMLADRSGFQGTYALQCRTGNTMPKELFAPGAPPPTKLFDNLYYVGLNSVGAYAVKTSAGIILIDSLNTGEDAEKVIVPGMKTLGLDPAQIKYILVSHGHGDHYGGAQWLKDRYGARIVASAKDWEYMARPMTAVPGRPAPKWSPPPKRDLVGTDGQKLTLGDTTITLVLTPGHTPGTLSFIVPVIDKGKAHMLAMWGGTSIPNVAAAHRDYLTSFDHFATFTMSAKVDAELSNHPFVDDGLTRMAALRANPDGANPFVIGAARYADYTGILKECASAAPATEAAPAAGPAAASTPARP